MCLIIMQVWKNAINQENNIYVLSVVEDAYIVNIYLINYNIYFNTIIIYQL